MKAFILICILLYSQSLMAQEKWIGWDKGMPKRNRAAISHKHFEALKADQERFIPYNVRKDTIVIVRYSPERLQELWKIAQTEGYVRLGKDTSVKQSLLNKNQEKRMEGIFQWFAVTYPDLLKRSLENKGIESVIVDEKELLSGRYQDMYRMLTACYSSYGPINVKHPKNSYMILWGNQFYDPNHMRHFDLFLNTKKYNLVDLIN
jgi:hypothetical protein